MINEILIFTGFIKILASPGSIFCIVPDGYTPMYFFYALFSSIYSEARIILINNILNKSFHYR